MTICSNREEGFGPKSNLSFPVPTSCFIDTILTPLPIWLALLTTLLFFLISVRHRKQNYNPSTYHLRTRAATRSCAYKTVAAIYYILILANILMQILEIVRLELISFGIGLLPFVIAGLLLGGTLHFTEGFNNRVRYWQAVNAILWFGGLAMTVLKVAGLAMEGVDKRKGSKYPMGDQITDTAVMAGLYAVLCVLEVGLGVWRGRRGGKSGEEMSLASGGMSPVRAHPGVRPFGK